MILGSIAIDAHQLVGRVPVLFQELMVSVFVVHFLHKDAQVCVVFRGRMGFDSSVLHDQPTSLFNFLLYWSQFRIYNRKIYLEY